MAKLDKSTEFSMHMVDICNQVMVVHGIGLGSRLGIFEAMISMGKPETCENIAAAGKWKPRYIQEWLNLMVIGNIICYDEENKTYHIPEERQPALSYAGRSKNMGIFCELFAKLAAAEKELKSCFPENGPTGISYSSYNGFFEWRSRQMDTNVEWEGGLKDILQNQPKLFKALDEGAKVIDGCCGSANQLMLMAKNFPKSSFLGFDLSEDGIQRAKAKCKEANLTNVTLEIRDACKELPKDWGNSVDVFIVFDAIHDLPNPSGFLKEIFKVLKSGGIFFMSDINMRSDVKDNKGGPISGMMYGVSLYHCLPISLAMGQSDALGTAWGIEKQREYLKEAGFNDIHHLDVPDVFNSYFVSYKSG